MSDNSGSILPSDSISQIYVQMSYMEESAVEMKNRIVRGRWHQSVWEEFNSSVMKPLVRAVMGNTICCCVDFEQGANSSLQVSLYALCNIINIF